MVYEEMENIHRSVEIMFNRMYIEMCMILFTKKENREFRGTIFKNDRNGGNMNRF